MVPNLAFVGDAPQQRTPTASQQSLAAAPAGAHEQDVVGDAPSSSGIAMLPYITAIFYVPQFCCALLQNELNRACNPLSAGDRRLLELSILDRPGSLNKVLNELIQRSFTHKSGIDLTFRRQLSEVLTLGPDNLPLVCDDYMQSLRVSPPSLLLEKEAYNLSSLEDEMLDLVDSKSKVGLVVLGAAYVDCGYYTTPAVLILKSTVVLGEKYTTLVCLSVQPSMNGGAVAIHDDDTCDIRDTKHILQRIVVPHALVGEKAKKDTLLEELWRRAAVYSLYINTDVQLYARANIEASCRDACDTSRPCVVRYCHARAVAQELPSKPVNLPQFDVYAKDVAVNENACAIAFAATLGCVYDDGSVPAHDFFGMCKDLVRTTGVVKDPKNLVWVVMQQMTKYRGANLAIHDVNCDGRSLLSVLETIKENYSRDDDPPHSVGRARADQLTVQISLDFETGRIKGMQAICSDASAASQITQLLKPGKCNGYPLLAVIQLARLANVTFAFVHAADQNDTHSNTYEANQPPLQSISTASHQTASYNTMIHYLKQHAGTSDAMHVDDLPSILDEIMPDI